MNVVLSKDCYGIGRGILHDEKKHNSRKTQKKRITKQLHNETSEESFIVILEEL